MNNLPDLSRELGYNLTIVSHIDRWRLRKTMDDENTRHTHSKKKDNTNKKVTLNVYNVIAKTVTSSYECYDPHQAYGFFFTTMESVSDSFS